jgi:glycosyltransferase involved in cell wall biosynthesis
MDVIKESHTRLRILFLMNQDLESPAGAGRFFPLARGLVKLGHEVHIAALHSNFSSVKQTHFEQDGVNVWYLSQMQVLKRDNQKIYFPTHKLIYLMGKATIKLTYAALRIPADIVHISKPQPMNSIAGLAALRFQGKRLFLDCDDLEAANNRFGGIWQRRIIALFENSMPKIADCVTTHTTILRDRMIALGVPGEKICYIPNGMDTERFASPSAEEVKSLKCELGLNGKKVILFVGSMSLVSHAVNVLIEAMPTIVKEEPDAVLLLVGGGEDYDNLQKLGEKMNLGDRIRFMGRVSPQKAVLAYQLAHVSVDPIHDNEAGRASLSLKMFETWASGIPLVTSDVGDRRQITGVPPAAVLVPPGDPQKLAQAILQVLKDHNLAGALIEQGRERSSLYSWDILAKTVEAAYKNVLNR